MSIANQPKSTQLKAMRKKRVRRNQMRLLFATILIVLIIIVIVAFCKNKDANSAMINTPNVIVTPEVVKYDYAQPVPKKEEVTDDYFNDAVFIGDSRTEGFMLYSGLENATFYVHQGMMVDTVLKEPYFNSNGNKVSTIKAMSAQETFGKVYIMLGINELGWKSNDTFVEKYSQIIDEIRVINPNTIIYIQSIFPVSQKKSNLDKTYTNQRILEFNTLIKDITNKKEVYYVNVAEAVSDENGNLPEEASTDGVHLKKEYCEKWLTYLKSHTI